MDAIEDARYRAAIYRNLSAFFNDAPSAEELGALVEVATELANADEAVGDAERGFYAYLSTLSGRDLEELRRSIASEYAELFIGPRPPLAPYYESIYLGYPNRLFTDQTMAVQQFYEECGFHVIKSGQVPGDNAAYELELMALLADREAELSEAGDSLGAEKAHEQQMLFLGDHLGAWIGLLANRIDEAPCADFYSAASRFAEKFIEEDKDYLANTALRAASQGD